MDANRASQPLIFSEKNGHCKQGPNINFIRIYSLFFTTNIFQKYQQITRDLFFVKLLFVFSFY